MRVLLDECVPCRLARDLPFDVSTAPGMGLAGLSNGELLRAASPEFDVSLTLDQTLQYQQNLAEYPIAVLVVHSPSNRYDDIRPILPAIVAALESIGSDELVVVPH